MRFIYFIFLWFPFVVLAQTEHKIRLYYENDIHTLHEAQYKKIDSIKQLAIASDSLVVQIDGYANAYGTDTYNLYLSKKRAMTVAALFDQNYVIYTQGFGELESTSAENRRVDILLSSYVFEKEDISSTEESEEKTTINDLSNLGVGDKVVLKGILFVGGTDRILPESTIALQELFTYLNTHKEIRIHLIGHICCHGTMNPKIDGINLKTGNKSLSADRAKAIFTFLLRRGINVSRMTYEGRAYLEPLGKGDKYDRRVEIEIIE